MWKRLFLAPILMILSGCTQPGISDFRYQKHEEITISGRIDSRTSEKFAVFVNQQRVTTSGTVIIRLNSKGGEMRAAESIMSGINRLKTQGKSVIVIVDDDSECMSACTIIFTRGDYRIAGDTSTWMFHAPWVFSSTIDIDKIDIPMDRKTQIKRELERAKTVMMQCYRMIDPDFTAWLDDNYISTPGKEYRASGKELSEKSNRFISQII